MPRLLRAWRMHVLMSAFGALHIAKGHPQWHYLILKSGTAQQGLPGSQAVLLINLSHNSQLMHKTHRRQMELLISP